MSLVTKCDACDSVMANEKAAYLRLFTSTKEGRMDKEIHNADLCPECYKKICQMIHQEVKKLV